MTSGRGHRRRAYGRSPRVFGIGTIVIIVIIVMMLRRR